VQTWHCQICQKDVPIRVRGFLVGRPTVFVACRNCWKGHLLPLVSIQHTPIKNTISGDYKFQCGSRAVLNGTVDLWLERVNLHHHSVVTEEDVRALMKRALQE